MLSTEKWKDKLWFKSTMNYKTAVTEGNSDICSNLDAS